MKKLSLLICLLSITLVATGQVRSVSADKDWKKQVVELKNTDEADYIIRIGDVDNLGFGWPDGFDPFCGQMTDSHSYPFEPSKDDIKGTDCILLSSSFNVNRELPCGSDGYTYYHIPKYIKPQSFKIPTQILIGVTPQDAWLQLFIDDFQSPSFCSRFQVTLGGKRFTEAEMVLNAIDQTGPVGKLVSIPIPEGYFEALGSGKELILYIDEVTGAGDGFALDFIRLLVNRKKANTCKGNLSGYVLDKISSEPIEGAIISTYYGQETISNAEGRFELKDLYAGYEVLVAAKAGYQDARQGADIAPEDASEIIYIYMDIADGSIEFNETILKAGDKVVLNNILFEKGKATIRPEVEPELIKLLTLMQKNEALEIELSGHTSSEGDLALNRSLSLQRVNACKEYLVNAGIDPFRISTIGYGPDKPVAPNDTEANRTKNRRVEMRIVKM
jgi:OOP family OmpA-OmpF porin